MRSHKDNIHPPEGSILRVTNGCLLVDEKPFCVDYPDEILHDVEDNRLVTKFRGHLDNYWSHDEIEGYWA